MLITINGVPSKDGFRMPAEYEPHSGCWMQWPERRDTWRAGGKFAQEAYSNVAAVIAKSEQVTVGVTINQMETARKMLPSKVRVVEMEYDDAWIRDTGPTFLVNDKGELRGVDWQFNAWGGINEGLYFPWDMDSLVGQKVLELENADRYEAPIVLEGGSIHVDGEGTLITTEECLLNPNRNPDLSKNQIEGYLKDYLNVSNIIWLKHGVYNDETNGHVDNLCCFVNPGVVALTWTDDESDPQYDISLDAYNRMSESTNASGKPLDIHKIVHPKPMYRTDEESLGIESNEKAHSREVNERLAASYVNFYISNSHVIMPFFGEETDALAQKQIQELFPNRKVVGISSREILLGGGNIHCITQQVPSVGNH